MASDAVVQWHLFPGAALPWLAGSFLVVLSRRPGRLEVQVEIGLPDEEGRFKILRIHSAKMKENSFLSADVDLMALGEGLRPSPLKRHGPSCSEQGELRAKMVCAPCAGTP